MRESRDARNGKKETADARGGKHAHTPKRQVEGRAGEEARSLRPRVSKDLKKSVPNWLVQPKWEQDVWGATGVASAEVETTVVEASLVG